MKSTKEIERDSKVLKQKTLTKQKIASLCDETFLKVHSLLEHFGIDYVEHSNRIAFPCPIHDGDNPEACCIFTDGISNQGNWSCWTHHCEEEHVGNMFGFTRGCLARQRNKDVSMNETASFLCSFLNKELNELSETTIKQSKSIDVFNRKIKREQPTVDKSTIRSKLNIPSEYYVRRGYKPETLNLFDVGECLAENQPMSGRVVVPIYDETDNYVGCVGRSIKEHLKPKWLHSKGFNKNILYGLNIAKDRILETRTACVVEGQGDVWRLFEAGLDMSVGIFGASINEDQLILLEQSGALNLIVLTDYDDAGEKAAKQIMKKCGRRFNYIRPSISKNFKDVGDMTIQQIKDEIYPVLKKGIIKDEH
jgi:5S rRNA maturation endonuclease (ribonuclease M5)